MILAQACPVRHVSFPSDPGRHGDMKLPRLQKLLNLMSVFLIASGVSSLAWAAPLEMVRNKGWWVIVGTFPTDPWERQKKDSERMNAIALRCDAQLFNDFSQKFRGFSPGFNVFVVGAFDEKSEAEENLLKIKICFPDAYLKYGEYLGE
jgi:hypothetical protein